MKTSFKPRLLLVTPPQFPGNKNIWSVIRGFPPQLGLASLAAYVERAGIDVEILDAYAKNLDPEAFKKTLINIKEPDFIGFSSTTPVIHNAYKYSKIAKDIFPHSRIVFGGVHPTILPDEVLSQPHVDYVIRGEGEQTILELVGGVDIQKINGLSYKKVGTIYHNPDRTLLDLEQLPMPAYHLLPMKSYKLALGAARRSPATSMIISRGCPNRCSFCYGDMFGRKIRRKTLEQVIDEITFLQTRFHIREISFYDDTFTTDKNFVVQLCERIIRDGISISWSCFSRVNFVDEEILKLMKRAGCHQLMYGLESADERILKELKKNQTLEQIEKAVDVTKKTGINLRISFMLGNPGETEESIKKTCAFVMEINPDIMIVNILTPYPGTAIYNWAKQEGLLLTEDWNQYDLSNIILNSPGLPVEFIKKTYHSMYRKFYLRPGYIIKRLFKMRTTTEWFEAFKAFLALLVR